MKRLAIAIHVLFATLISVWIAALLYLFITSSRGSYLHGSLNAAGYDLMLPGMILEFSLILGFPMLLCSVARVIQLASGAKRFSRWSGLRLTSNFMLITVILITLSLMREFRIITAAFGLADISYNSLQSDSTVSFPKLPLTPQEDVWDTLELRAMDGTTVKFSDFRGKTLFVNVWATWCGPCCKELPNIENLYNTMKAEKDIAFALISPESPEVVAAFLAKNPNSAPVYTVAREAFDELGIPAYPTTLFFSKTGETVFTKSGSVAWDGGMTREFLLALARDLPFAPYRSGGASQILPDGIGFDPFVITADVGAADVAVSSDGKIYFSAIFKNTIELIDRKAKKTSIVLEALKSPKSLAIDGDWLYFTELGTEAEEFKDGTLSRVRLSDGVREIVAGNLQHPNALFVSGDGSVYVTEAPGGCTTFGGTDRLIVFRSGKTTLEEVFKTARAPTAVVLDSEGSIYIGEMGDTSAGDTGRIRKYAKGNTQGEVIVSGLPAVQDMVIDAKDTIFVTGYSANTKVGISKVMKGAHESLPIINRQNTDGLCMTSNGNVYYASSNQIFELRSVLNIN